MVAEGSLVIELTELDELECCPSAWFSGMSDMIHPKYSPQVLL